MPEFDFKAFLKKTNTNLTTTQVDQITVSPIRNYKPSKNLLNLNLYPERTIRFSNYEPTSDELSRAYYLLTHNSPNKDQETMLQEIVHNSIRLLKLQKKEDLI